MIRRALLVMLALSGPASPLAAQDLYYEGGVSGASGTYIFAERTTSWSLTTGIAVGSRRMTVRASLPVYLQNSTLVALSGPTGGLPTGGSSNGAVADSGAARKRRPGGGDGTQAMMVSSAMASVEVPATAVTGYEAAIGDPTAQLSWRALDGPRTGLTASLLAKAPLADTATFGTGQWDVGSSLGLSQALGRFGLVGLEAAYWHLGDMSTLNFHDPVYGTASLAYLKPSSWGGGVSVSAGTSALDGYDGPVWLGGYVVRTSGGASWAISGTVGLTETTPDVTVGVSWRISLLRASDSGTRAD